MQIGTFALSVFNNYGYTEQVLNIINPLWFNDNTKTKNFAVRLRVKHKTEEVSFTPTAGNIIDLGSTTFKWKTINGINPGALSLPSISSTGANAWIALDTTDWVKNTAVSFAQKYTPLADGWLNVRVDNATMLAIAVGGNYMHQIIRSETANSLALLMPVFKNTEVAIMVGGNENLAYNRVTFYYCQGNV